MNNYLLLIILVSGVYAANWEIRYKGYGVRFDLPECSAYGAYIVGSEGTISQPNITMFEEKTWSLNSDFEPLVSIGTSRISTCYNSNGLPYTCTYCQSHSSSPGCVYNGIGYSYWILKNKDTNQSRVIPLWGPTYWIQVKPLTRYVLEQIVIYNPYSGYVGNVSTPVITYGFTQNYNTTMVDTTNLFLKSGNGTDFALVSLSSFGPGMQQSPYGAPIKSNTYCYYKSLAFKPIV